MSIDERITVSFEDMSRNLEQGLDMLRRFQIDSAYRYTLGGTFVEHLGNWIRQIRERRKDPFTLVVAGEFKKGKSSLINALLGEKILPSNVAPETVTLNRLSYGPHRNEAVLSGGKRLSLSDEELRRKSLKKLEEEVGEPIFRLELQRPNELLRDICIIDTPGMNEALTRFEDMVAEALAQADAVIYVYSVQTPLSRSERMYLKYSLLPQQYTKLFLVGNYADTIPEDEFGEMMEFVEKRVGEVLSGEKGYVVSALDELCRIQGADRPCEELAPVLEARFGEFRGDLERMIREKKEIIVLDRMQRICRLMKEGLTRDLDSLEKGIGMDRARLEREKENLRQLREQRADRLDRARRELHEEIRLRILESRSWLDALIDRMENEDLSLYTTDDLLQYYSYYCVDLVQRAVQESLLCHREVILGKLHEISSSLSRELAGGQEKMSYVDFAFRLDNNTWTKGDSVTLAITQIGGNSLMSLVSDLVGSMVRRKEVEADKGDIVEKIRGQYPQLRKSAKENMEKQYARLESSADKILEDYFGGQIAEAEEAMKLSEEAGVKNEEGQNALRKAIEEVREALEKAF